MRRDQKVSRVGRRRRQKCLISVGFGLWIFAACLGGGWRSRDGGTRARRAGNRRRDGQIVRFGARRIRDRRVDRARSTRIRGVNFPRARVRRGVAGASALAVDGWVSGARTSAVFDGWILSNSTTRPPLSPVARCSPVLSNSTALIMSAALAIGDRDGASGQSPRVGYRGLSGKSDIVVMRVASRGWRWMFARSCSPSCTSSPGVRSPNTWLKFQSSCPRGSLAAAIVPRPRLSPTLSPHPPPFAVAHSSADVAPRACFFPATGPRRNGTHRR